VVVKSSQLSEVSVSQLPTKINVGAVHLDMGTIIPAGLCMAK